MELADWYVQSMTRADPYQRNRVRITLGGHHVIARLTGRGTHLVFTPATEGAPDQMLTPPPGPLQADITGAPLHDNEVHIHVAARLVSLG